MIELRAAERDADYEAWLSVRRAVLPNERTLGMDEMRAIVKPDDLHLLAYLDGELAGSGLVNRSDTGGAHVAPRVLPDKRGRGVGSALLRHLARHATQLGYTRAGSRVDGNDAASIAFAGKFGFEERRRDVQQVLSIDDVSPAPRELDGVEFVSIAERPELLAEAYAVALQGYEDMPIDGIDIPIESWLQEEATLPAGSFVALANGEIVGYAGLMRWPDDPSRAEHGMTVVRRDWRRRGLASALKQREIAWAGENGIRELVTWTQTGNEKMQRVNERLGYVVRSYTITFTRDLPL
jgi:mycothiol synthase